MIKRTKRRSVVARMTNAFALAVTLGMVAGPALAQQTDAGLQSVASGMGHPFVSNAKAGVVLRTAYFQRDNGGDESAAKAGKFLAEGMGLGGWLYGSTGELADILSFGATYNFVVPLYTPNDVTANTALLSWPDQDKAVSVLGEAYAKLRFGNHAVTLGRQEINNSWYTSDVVRFYNTIDQGMVGRYDIRGMQPIHFEAATVKGRVLDDTMRYYGGYIWNVRANNSNDFVSPGEYNGKRETDGAAYAGLQYKPSKDSLVEGSYYAFKDLFNMVYAQGEYVHRLADKNYLRFGGQYFYQEGNGNNLLSPAGRDFSTDAFALYTEIRLTPYVIPYASVGWTDKEYAIQSPFAIGPHYATHRYAAMPVAGETTYFIGNIFDFGPFGARGLSFDLAYAHRTDRVQNFNAGPLPDWDELSTDLIYVHPGDNIFKNMRVRLRWAKVVESGGNITGDRDTFDTRFDVSWMIPFK